jgi:hypothetical protein
MCVYMSDSLCVCEAGHPSRTSTERERELLSTTVLLIYYYFTTTLLLLMNDASRTRVQRRGTCVRQSTCVYMWVAVCGACAAES